MISITTLCWPSRLFGFPTLHDGSGGPQDGPRGPQDCPKRGPKRGTQTQKPSLPAQEAPGGPRGPQEGRIGSREAAKRPEGAPRGCQGAAQESPKSQRALMLVRCLRNFRVLAFSARGSKRPPNGPHRGPKRRPDRPERGLQRLQNCFEETPRGSLPIYPGTVHKSYLSTFAPIGMGVHILVEHTSLVGPRACQFLNSCSHDMWVLTHACSCDLVQGWGWLEPKRARSARVVLVYIYIYVYMPP